jgi:hypothetical protein
MSSQADIASLPISWSHLRSRPYQPWHDPSMSSGRSIQGYVAHTNLGCGPPREQGRPFRGAEGIWGRDGGIVALCIRLPQPAFSRML